MLVGTAFVDERERMPSSGRLVIFRFKHQLSQHHFEFVEFLNINGSIQAIQTFKQGRYLILGVNNCVRLCKLNRQNDLQYAVEQIYSLATGMYI